MTASGSIEGTVLCGWGPGGLGVRAGRPAADPPWLARAARPLLLVRRTGDELREEHHAFTAVQAGAASLEAEAAFTDTRGARWHVRLHAVPADVGGGWTGALRWTLESGPGDGVFVGHRLEVLADPDDLYVCMPGSVYDGNDFITDHKDIPRASRTGLLDVPTTSLAMPCLALHARAAGASIVLAGRQRALTADGAGLNTSIRWDERDRVRPTAALVAPILRLAHYKLADLNGDFRFHHLPAREPGATLQPGQWIELPLAWFAGGDDGVPAFFGRLAALRPHFRAGHARRRDLPLSEAASLVAFNQDRYHWQEAPGSPGFYANACEVDGRNANQLMTGWGSGIITGYGLLAVGDTRTRERATRMMDFIAATAVSPSGLFCGAYENGQWDEGRALLPSENIAPWRHIRTSEDGTLYMLRAVRQEEARGIQHPAWRAAVKANLDAMLRLWERYGEFGREIDRRTGDITVPGSAAGALCIACLAEGSALFGEPRYLAAAAEAGDSYYARFIATGHTTGGPLDIFEAPDSESCLMFPCGYMALHERTGDARWLRYAAEAADQLASWTLAYDGAFPPGTRLDRLGIQTTGGVIANAQNHHIGPGGASTSLSSLLALYRATGEDRFLVLLEDHATALAQYLSRYDGAIDRLAKGMMTEQVNLTDAMNHATGEIWNVSASWSANNIVLARAELPGVYVDTARRRVALLDHVEAAPDWSAGTVRVANPTAFTARTGVQVDGGAPRELVLEPGASAVVKLA